MKEFPPDGETAVLQPVWAREDAFPPARGGWGWVDSRGKAHPCADAASLLAALRDDPSCAAVVVWSPEHPHMLLPEEDPLTADAVKVARRRDAKAALEEAVLRLRWFAALIGVAVVLTIYPLLSGHAGAPGLPSRLLRELLRSHPLGIALLMFLIFAFIPWYQSRKRHAECSREGETDTVESLRALRFETWLDWQKAPVTRLVMGLMAAVGLCQLLPGDSVQAAALVSQRVIAGEWWRLFTAPFLHGNPLHFLMNGAALLYLGRRMEVFARWPHLPLVFLLAAWSGGIASVTFLRGNSVGASGGLMGWLGFLLVFESLHRHLVPRSATRRLLAGLLLTLAIGIAGYRYIDNAAHIGGVLIGMAYALIVFPKSESSARPRMTWPDLIAGGAALLAMCGAAAFTVWRILGARV